MEFGDRWFVKTLTQIPPHWYSRQTWLLSMHCSQKMFHFLSVSDGPVFILPNIPITLRKRFCRMVFLKSHKYLRQIFYRRKRDVMEKTSFLRCIWDVLKTSQKRSLFWDVWKRSLRCQRCHSQRRSDWDLSETSNSDWEWPIQYHVKLSNI